MLIKIKNNQKTEKSSSSSSSSNSQAEIETKPVEKLKFGEQLQDDVMNSFCDKLQSICPKKIDGFLAIQFLMCDPENVKKHITGKNEAIQILFDRGRVHYVLSHYNPKVNLVMIYDSLQLWDQTTGVPLISNEIVEYLRCLYSHHFPGEALQVGIAQNYDQQQDDFSCGYRAIGAVIDIARGQQPAENVYSRTAILEFIQQIMHSKKPRWEWFQDVHIHRNERKAGEPVIHKMVIPPKVPSNVSMQSKPSSSRSKSATSVGNVSTASSFSNKSGKSPSRRSQAGNEVVENLDSIAKISPKLEPENSVLSNFLTGRSDLLGFSALKSLSCFLRVQDDLNEDLEEIVKKI